jgi:hypothetical protein
MERLEESISSVFFHIVVHRWVPGKQAGGSARRAAPGAVARMIQLTTRARCSIVAACSAEQQ